MAIKRTAANTPDIARVKTYMNAKVAKRYSALYNTEGKKTADNFLATFFRKGTAAVLFGFDTADERTSDLNTQPTSIQPQKDSR